MMRTRAIPALTALLLAAALTVTGCGGSDSGSNKGASSTDQQDAAQDGAKSAPLEASAKDDAQREAQGGRLKLTPTALIRTAQITVSAKDVAAAVEDARTTAETAGGYVGHESTSSDEGDEHAALTLRIPAAAYDETLEEAAGLGDRLLSREVKVEDVTEQVVDVDSRVKSAKASVVRTRALMDKATALTDIVTLENELSTRQANVEALLAQQTSLKDRTSMGTIKLTVYAPDKAPETKDDPTVLSALKGGWTAFTTTLLWIAMILAATLPFAALAALLYAVARRFVRPRRNSPPELAATAGEPTL
ncbi:DUF4349 domain-containing protein [Streptomyces polyrhachis]|uniref:DUF4349 domain-containing protein n=1 Tax=Streptomyces polyrhachis TaxID=1282885 RepID=A0ABW2GC57_9ACTN